MYSASGPDVFTFVCPSKITGFNDTHGDFRVRDAALIGTVDGSQTCVDDHGVAGQNTRGSQEMTYDTIRLGALVKQA